MHRTEVFELQNIISPLIGGMVAISEEDRVVKLLLLLIVIGSF